MPSTIPFEPQPLEAPLNDEAKRKLRDLAAKRVNDYSLFPRVNKALDLLDKNVGPLIDRAVEEKERHEKKRARLAERGEEQDPKEQEQYEAFQTKVQELTKRMDQSIRQVVDTRVWLEALPASLDQVARTACSHGQSQATQQSDIRSTQDASPRSFNRDRGGNDDDDDEQEGGQGSSTQAIPADKTPSAVLEATLTAQQSAWSAKTLTDRYAHDNDYVGWYTNRWNALNPGESAPPMPSASIWFAAEEGRRRGDSPSAGQDGNGPDGSDSDSDVEIEREKISIKCPITLMPFEEPVMSSKCNHSFEKTAILSMIQRSDLRRELPPEEEAELAAIARPRDRAQRRARLQSLQPIGIKCPECRVFFLEEDLRPNPVLKRRVQRQLEWQRRQEERARMRDEADDDDDDDIGSDDGDGDSDGNAARGKSRGTQARPVGVGSSPVLTMADRYSAVKKDERVPETQPPATSTVMDLDEDI